MEKAYTTAQELLASLQKSIEPLLDVSVSICNLRAYTMFCKCHNAPVSCCVVVVVDEEVQIRSAEGRQHPHQLHLARQRFAPARKTSASHGAIVKATC